MKTVAAPDQLLVRAPFWEALVTPSSGVALNGFHGKHWMIRRPPASLIDWVQQGGMQPVSASEKWAQMLLERGVLEPRWKTAPEEPFEESWLKRFRSQIAWLSQFERSSGLSRWQMAARLRASKVAVVGLGGAGSQAAMMLAAAGVGELLLVDGDRVDHSNLVRQLYYTEQDAKVGKLKTQALKERLKDFTSFTRVETQDTFVNGPEHARAIFSKVDFVLLAADAPRVTIQRWFNQAAFQESKPFSYAFAGQVGPLVVPGQSACFECFEATLRSTAGVDYDSMVESLQSRRTWDYPSFVGGIPQTAQIQFMECVSWLTQAWAPNTLNCSLKFSYSRVEPVPVARVRDCTQCGDAP
jgi:molybdopterin/thiamine biosynthesis adenylyltransferase